MPTAAASGPQRSQPVFGFDAGDEGSTRRWRHYSSEHGSNLVRTAFINGLPGFVTREADGELQTTALEIEDGMVAAIYVMRNPDKLRHLH